MSDYWTGYNHGRSSRNDFGMALVAAAIAAAIGFIATGFVLAYPLATVLAIVAACVSAWLLSALISVLWHDPSPVYLFGSHSFYANPLGILGGIVLGLAVAWLALKRLEFQLDLNPTYHRYRHVWRVFGAPILLIIILDQTRDRTGIAELGVWLIPIAVGVVLHFLLRDGELSLGAHWRTRNARLEKERTGTSPADRVGQATVQDRGV